MKEVVIVGGGFVGSNVAKKLENNFNVTLIDSKKYFEFTPSIIKTIANPKFLKKIRVFYKGYLKKSKVILGKVSSVHENHVLVGNKKFNFDYLILASGSYYESPVKKRNVSSLSEIKDFKKINSKIKSSKKIAVIGGGVVGVELTSELITKFPQKEISLFTLSKKIIERNNKKSQERAKNFLLKKGANLFFGENVCFKKKGVFCNENKKIIADHFFVCTGIKRNSEFLKKGKIPLGKKGGVVVDDFLRVLNTKNVFAGGDLTSIPEEKTAQSAVLHAKIISKNIICLERGKTPKKYAPKKRVMVISLGRFSGIFEYKEFSFGGVFPSLIKRLIEIKQMSKFR